MELSRLGSVLVAASFAFTAGPAGYARAQTDLPSPVQVVGTATATVKEDQRQTVFALINQGPPQVLNALAVEPSMITLSFETDAPGCPAKPEAGATPVPTKEAIPTGGVGRLRVRACGELKGASQAVSVWGTAGGALATLKVQLGDAEAKPVVAPLESVELNVRAGREMASGTFCLPGTAEGTVGFVRSGTTIGTVVLRRPPTPKVAPCPAPTTQAVLSVSFDGGPGTYVGKIDSNGPAEGGVLSVTVNARRRPITFWFWLLLGMAVATGIGWWARFGRDWGFVDQTAADVRAAVWSAQEDLRAKLADACGPGPHRRWVVVSPKAPRPASLAIDKELAEYASLGHWLRRFVEAPSADRLAAGARVTALRTAAKTYLDTLDVAMVLVEWRRSATKPSSPTVLVVDDALTGDALPASGAIASLKAETDAAHGLVKRFNGLRKEAKAVEAEARRLGESEIADAAAAFVEALWQKTLDDAGVKTLRVTLDGLRQRLEQRAPAKAFTTQDALDILGDAANLNDLLGMPTVGQHYGALVQLTPQEQAAVIRRRNLRVELGIATLGLGVAFLSAYAGLYAPNMAWGTEKDVLAAVTWAASAGGALQVARHLTTRPAV